ncbi:unnamed protein product [Bursaphelenchus xylophilus]|uniref:(pine wood nematode) hypothetical protein n=1 Tax=Bursaphelenchus xylophilus TaxID=6326 RepID=A0A1I7RZ34_BURXY|nr:unnamed protein product [Bursaphelenchus xylophilus]CAG9106901.1 unnamed protein product [Bursaphelenchus xylophilus]
MSGKASSFNLTLIDAYYQHPMLYDNRHRDYKVQNPTKEAWLEVSRICSSTPDECRARWKALRDRFIKERKKKNANSLYKAAWPLYHKMEFLEPFIEHAHKKDVRMMRAHALNDLPRRTIENVVALLVREAQGNAMTSQQTPSMEVDTKIPLTTALNINPESSEVTVQEDGHELEKFYLRLIREVKQHQLLFDSSNSLYRVTAARNRVWEEIAQTFGEGYTASELRTKWRSIRDRYIRERRLYKESIQEGKPRFPKWSLYPEFSFLDYYVDQSFPRPYVHQEGHDNDSIHSGENQMHVDTEEQASPSSSSSTPSIVDPTPLSSFVNSSLPTNNNTINNGSLLQLFQKLIQNQQNQMLPGMGINGLDNGQAEGPNNLLLNNITSLIQPRPSRPRQSTQSNPSPLSTASLAEGVNEALADLNKCAAKLTSISQGIAENGLEYSFGHYVASELMRTPEPRRSDIRRAILALLSAENKTKNETEELNHNVSDTSTTS